MSEPTPGRTGHHHHVPQFYLRQWATNGQVFLYERHARDGRVPERRDAVRNTGFTSHLYTLEIEPLGDTQFDPNALEVALSKEERLAAAALNRMLSSGNSSWSPQDKIDWSRFIYLQLERTPSRLREAISMFEHGREDILEQYRKLPGAESAIDLFTPESARNLARARLIAPNADRDEWVSKLTQWSWDRMHSPRGGFVTSDQPVLLDTGGVTRGAPAWTVTIALSPSDVLICTPSSWRSVVDDGWLREMAATFNARLIAAGPRSVYAAQAMRDLPSPNCEKMLERFLAPT